MQAHVVVDFHRVLVRSASGIRMAKVLSACAGRRECAAKARNDAPLLCERVPVAAFRLYVEEVEERLRGGGGYVADKRRQHAAACPAVMETRMVPKP